ncbi:MAG: hypothetical protein AVO38_09995 [delta proteobacterium ML8_D]|nr:MAG: hypothetical protein AVO38_09995 [delta proteobacterium ML8_D]
MHYIFQKQAGPSAARNCGIAECKGEFAAFLDADDEWLPGYLEKAVGIIQEDNSAGLTYSWQIRRDEQGGETIRNYRSPSRNKWHTILWPNPLQCTSSTLCRKKFLDKVGGFDESLKTREDLDLWIRLGEISRVIEIPEPLVRVHKQKNSYSTIQPFEQMRTDYFKIIDKALNRAPHIYMQKKRIIMAEAFRYWGQHALYYGNMTKARQDLAHSIKTYPSMSAFLSLAVSSLPAGVQGLLRDYYSKRL